jgi:Dolichyl-phosphate-mannose-protein mannosyltransferase
LSAAQFTASRNDRKGDQRLLFGVILCIFALKLAFALLVLPHFKGDLKFLYSVGSVDNYYSIAQNLDNGTGYRFDPDTSLTLMREPGYPYFLAALRGTFDDYLQVVIAANILFTSICALLIFNLASKITASRWAPLIAPFLFVLHPAVVLAEVRYGVEIPFTLLLLAFLLFLRKALIADATREYIKAGIVLGVVSCVRSTALLFPLFLIFYGFLFNGGWKAVLPSLSRIALILACAFLVLSPWIVRNYLLVGKFIPTASVGGVAMQAGYYMCTHEGTGKQFYELDLDAAAVRNELATQQGYRFKPNYFQFFYDPKDEVRFNDSLAAQVVAEYKRSPTVFVECAAENVFNFWFRGKTTAVTLVNICIQLPYMILAFAGVLLGFRRMERPAWGLFVLFILYTMAVYVPIHAQARYSTPLVPILAIFAAIALERLFTRRFSPAQRHAMLPMQA